MILFKKSAQLIAYVSKIKETGNKIGFVPTMGALHKGHLSLLEASAKNNKLTICSIFVNPTQFNDPNDLRKYPVTLEKDIHLLSEAGTDLIFLPDASEIYPNGFSHLHHYPLGYLENSLEGKSRPGHFQGVCQVMDRLLDIIQPDNLYMGQKDYQQCMVVAKLLEIKQAGIVLNTCPTLRERDGLAMSSRNMRLNTEDRKNAIAIFIALNHIKENFQPGNLEGLKNNAHDILKKHQFKPDYVEITDAVTLQTQSDWDGKQKLVALVAAFINEVRLIDNMIL